jgi:rubredoxin-NAD+ reductase
MSPIVIVGSGLAGWTLARELRKLDKRAPVTLITADAGDFYSKPMLSNALASGKLPAQLINTPAESMAQQLDVRLLHSTQVRSIDAGARRIETSAGAQEYAKLVLALGADPIRLPLEGDAAGEVMSVNDLWDYARFRESIEGRKHIALIGAGLIGCEFANDLAGAGYRVSVIDPTGHPLSSLLPERAGRRMIAPLQAAGVAWHFGESVSAVNKAQEGYRLTLKGGKTIEAAAVLSAVGLRPRTALAKAAGLAVNRGIVVDTLLRTSDPDIFALGDCAEYTGRVLPYVLPIMHASRALAQTLAGKSVEVAFPPMPVIVKTPACPVAVQPVARDAAGAWQAEEDERGLKMTFTDPQGRLLGFALTEGRIDERSALTKLLAS